jgi:hypothetical protein
LLRSCPIDNPQGSAGNTTEYRRAAASTTLNCILATHAISKVKNATSEAEFEESAAFMHGRTLENTPMQLMARQDASLSTNNANRTAALLRGGMQAFQSFDESSASISAAAEGIRSKKVASSLIATINNAQSFSLSTGSNHTAYGNMVASWRCAGGAVYRGSQPQSFFITDAVSQNDPPLNLVCDLINSLTATLRSIPVSRQCSTGPDADRFDCEITEAFLREVSAGC